MKILEKNSQNKKIFLDIFQFLIFIYNYKPNKIAIFLFGFNFKSPHPYKKHKKFCSIKHFTSLE